MRDYARIMTKIRESIWLITPEGLSVILDIMDRRTSGESLSDEEIEVLISQNTRSSESNGSDDNGNKVVNGVGILPILGPIFGKANLMTKLSGATSLETFRDDLREMMTNDMVSSILLQIDSPGGTSDMVSEVADEIRAVKTEKPVYAIADSMAGSAAYWLMSQATACYATPSGSVGSIGAYTVHEDRSGADAQQGHKYTFISAGQYKTEGNPHQPLSEEGKAYHQELINELYDEFVEAVTVGRDTTPELVKSDFGEGRMVPAKRALDAGMIDGVMPYEKLVNQLVNQPRRVQVAMPTAAAAKTLANMLSSTDDTIRLRAAQTIVGVLGNDGVVRLESKEWEHSEPGTGTPPQPKKDEDGSDDIAIKEGWRRDTPPIAKPQANSDTSKGGNGVMEDKDLRELMRVLGVEDEDKIVETVKTKFSELSELRKAVSIADQERVFAEQYPQYWEQHTQLMNRDRTNTAKQFAESVSSIKKTEGYGLKSTKQGLSVQALEQVTNMHVKFAEGKATLEDFENCIKTIVHGGIVQFGSIGSSSVDDDLPELDTNTAAGIAGARKMFAEVVAKIQKDKPELDYQGALEEAAKKHPDLADAYRVTLPA